MPTLRDLLHGLQPIINTADASTLIRDPEGVALRYAPTGMIYRPSPRIARWAERITSELAAEWPVTGYVVGDFGYGKTAAALHLVRRCEAGGIVCVPPATYDRLAQMAEAINACVRRALEARMQSVAVDLGAAKAALPPAPSASEVVQFAAACTRLVRRAGYAGLLVVIDELQHFINRDEAVAARIQALSRLVQGVRDLSPVPASPGRPTTPGTPLGLVMLMPASPTEAILREQADDMMQRMEERETSLRLDDAYGEAFVRDVWAQVCEQLDDPAVGRRGVHDTTIVALGQLVARRDLSNGPRTMVQAFKQVAARLEGGGATYTALDLALDYEGGHLVFDGPSHRVRGAMVTLLRRPEVQGNQAFERASLLLAVFPDGVTRELADAIDAASPGGVHSTFGAVLDLNEPPHQWLGLTTLQIRDGAYALNSLQRDDRPLDVMSTLFRDFSAKYRNFDSSTRIKYALEGFIRYVIPYAFEARGPGRDTGFNYTVNGVSEWAVDSRGVSFRMLQGAPGQLFKEFPDRRLCLAVGTNPDDVGEFKPGRDVPVHLVWRIALVPASGLDVGAPAPLAIQSVHADPFVDVQVPLERTFGNALPPDLDLLRNNAAPERTNAQMLLALIAFTSAAIGGNRAMSDADRQRHEQLARDLTREVARLLLPDVADEVRTRVRGIALGRGGVVGSDKALLESLFATKCRELFPDYSPLAGHGQWVSNITRYITGLRGCNLAERRGQEKVERPRKSELANLFGLVGNVPYDNLSKYCKERGLFGPDTRDMPASVRGQEPPSTLVFTESPAEVQALAVLERKGRQQVLPAGGQARPVRALEYSVIRDELWKVGYLAEEVDEAIKLLEARQRVRRGSDGTVQQHPGDVTAGDLRAKLDAFERRVRSLELVIGADRVGTLTSGASSTRQRLAGQPDDIAIDRADHELRDSTTALDEAVLTAWQARQAELRTARGDMAQARGRLRLAEAAKDIVGSITIVGAINDTRRRLWAQVKACDAALVAVDVKVARLLDLSGPTDPAALELAASCGEVRRAIDAEAGRAERLGKLVETLTTWRRIVTDAGAYAPEPATAEATEFDGVICAPILDHLAGREPQRLANYEHYANLIEEWKARVERIRREKRDAFEHEREAYQSRIRDRNAIEAYALRTPFDLADLEGSRASLRAEVVEKLRPVTTARRAEVATLRDDLLFLQSERSLDVAEQIVQIDTATELLDQAEQRLLTAASVDAIGEVVELLVHTRDGAIGPVRARYEKLRTHVVEPDATEERVLEVLRAVQPARSTDPVSIERVRRANPGGQKLEDLLVIVGELYRKGHVEIQVRLRQ